MADFTELIDLASLKLGATALYANDDFFASKDNLLKVERPIFIEGKYTDRGKWMDGWESRRRRTPGHDFCLIRLGAPGLVRGVIVDTAFFKGNYPEACSIEGCSLQGQPTPEELLSASTPWVEVLPKVALQGDSANRFEVHSAHRCTHLRLNIFPDGGVARLRVHGEVVPDRRWLGPESHTQEVDLAAAENGGVVVLCNDMFFGSRHNLIMPGRAVNMGDGWETKRSRKEAPDWAIVQLAGQGTLTRIEVDTNHFKGNYPESVAIEVCDARHRSIDDFIADEAGWAPLLERTKLQPHTRHFFEHELLPHALATHARVRIFPDGGLSRLRLWGMVSEEGRATVGLRFLATLAHHDLVATLRACCTSQAWAEAVAKQRSFSSFDDLVKVSDRVWQALGHGDWLEAFRSHPRIGEKKSDVKRSAVAQQWSAREQTGVSNASEAVRAKLVELNRLYEDRFGYIYIVCATGKSAEEMLAIAENRLGNPPEREIVVAAEEQRKITNLRLEKLVKR